MIRYVYIGKHDGNYRMEPRGIGVQIINRKLACWVQVKELHEETGEYLLKYFHDTIQVMKNDESQYAVVLGFSSACSSAESYLSCIRVKQYPCISPFCGL